MEINWEATRAHAAERLRAEAPSDDRPAQAAALRRFLKLEGERLRMRRRLGLAGLATAAARSYVVDIVVAHACTASQPEGVGTDSWAVVALGGYGRAELSASSDVDLLFLHDGRQSALVKRLTEGTLQLLWDAGLSVGHSFRSPGECIAAARTDLHARTALTEARLLAGSGVLFHRLAQLTEALRQDRRAAAEFQELLRRDSLERYERFGRTVCVVEPNLKDGRGGLRDLHVAIWLGHARHGCRGLRGMRDEGWITRAEHDRVRRAYDFLMQVRDEAHLQSGRKTDLLTLDLQADLARTLQYRPSGGLLASELLMRDYYRHASELRRFAEEAWGPPPAPARRFFFERFVKRGRSRRALEVRGGGLFPRGPLRGGAPEILEAALWAQAEGLALSSELKQQIRDQAHVVDADYRASREAGRALLRLMRQRGRVGPALRALHETGVLGRLLPEFARITHLVQHDLFHRYTVDEHTLLAIEALDELASGADAPLARLGRALDETSDTAPLYLGLLLHDVGKGLGGGHVEKGVRKARRALERLRIDPDTRDKALFLVGAHLQMSQISQQRDLSEPRLIESFAASVASLERLNLLLLLTYADHRGVGPGIWNEWKAALLFELYDAARERLLGATGDEKAPGSSARDEAQAALGAEFPPALVEHHFATVPERYLRTTSAERMVVHFRLAQGLSGRGRIEWHDAPGSHWTEVSVVARDRPGLFAALAGALAANGVDIMGVDLHTRTDGVAIDVFRVADQGAGHHALRPERQARVGAALVKAIAGELDVDAAVDAWRATLPKRKRRHLGRAARPVRIRFDQEASALATAVEVRAPDQPGLAYEIARALADLGLDILSARVATAKALALDVFYVRDSLGRKLGSGAAADVERALLATLGERDAMKEAG